MALIKCPECKKKVSDTVSCCPKCGFSIVGYLSESRIYQGPRKNSRNKIKYFIISAIAMLLILLSFFVISMLTFEDGYIEDEESSVYPLFGDSITTANDLLGKEITPILNGYIEGEDYTLTSNEDCTIYTFPLESFVLGSTPNLNIFVDSSTSKIKKVEYSFRLEQELRNFKTNFYINSQNIRERLTDYYDTDPIYTYLDNNKHIKIDSDKFFSPTLKTTYYIKWENAKGESIISFTNLYEEKKEYGTLTFTKK